MRPSFVLKAPGPHPDRPEALARTAEGSRRDLAAADPGIAVGLTCLGAASPRSARRWQSSVRLRDGSDKVRNLACVPPASPNVRHHLTPINFTTPCGKLQAKAVISSFTGRRLKLPRLLSDRRTRWRRCRGWRTRITVAPRSAQSWMRKDAGSWVTGFPGVTGDHAGRSRVVARTDLRPDLFPHHCFRLIHVSIPGWGGRLPPHLLNSTGMHFRRVASPDPPKRQPRRRHLRLTTSVTTLYLRPPTGFH